MTVEYRKLGLTRANIAHSKKSRFREMSQNGQKLFYSLRLENGSVFGTSTLGLKDGL